jgi:hypothetical protein
MDYYNSFFLDSPLPFTTSEDYNSFFPDSPLSLGPPFTTPSQSSTLTTACCDTTTTCTESPSIAAITHCQEFPQDNTQALYHTSNDFLEFLESLTTTSVETASNSVLQPVVCDNIYISTLASLPSSNSANIEPTSNSVLQPVACDTPPSKVKAKYYKVPANHIDLCVCCVRWHNIKLKDKRKAKASPLQESKGGCKHYYKIAEDHVAVCRCCTVLADLRKKRSFYAKKYLLKKVKKDKENQN